jgi:signal transduction histidine kinase
VVLAGLVSSYVAAVTVRAEAELAAATAVRAATAERERLSRGIHNGVLQVLALVHRAGRDADGQWAQLGAAAGEQEVALRSLISSNRAIAPSGSLDLAEALRGLRTSDVTVSAPGEPVLLEASTVAEIVAATGAALNNVDLHAGSDAQAWVLLEDLPEQVRVTVRDDGTGFGPDRLDEATRGGRLGVANSIRRRIEQLSGSVTITYQPEEGTTVEMSVPK